MQPQDCWTELPDVLWTPLQRRLIDAMPGERVRPRAFRLRGTRLPRRLAATDSGDCERIAVESDCDLFGQPDASAIRLFHAGGHEAEIEEVFRRILKSGAPLDHRCSAVQNASSDCKAPVRLVGAAVGIVVVGDVVERLHVPGYCPGRARAHATARGGRIGVTNN
jgi:hypothetical protein